MQGPLCASLFLGEETQSWGAAQSVLGVQKFVVCQCKILLER